jgi:hypothetical protein
MHVHSRKLSNFFFAKLYHYNEACPNGYKYSIPTDSSTVTEVFIYLFNTVYFFNTKTKQTNKTKLTKQKQT